MRRKLRERVRGRYYTVHVSLLGVIGSTPSSAPIAIVSGAQHIKGTIANGKVSVETRLEECITACQDDLYDESRSALNEPCDRKTENRVKSSNLDSYQIMLTCQCNKERCRR